MTRCLQGFWDSLGHEAIFVVTDFACGSQWLGEMDMDPLILNSRVVTVATQRSCFDAVISS